MMKGKGLRVNSGLEQGGAIPFILRLVGRDFRSSTFCGDKQISHGGGIIPELESRAVSYDAVPHGLEGLP